MDYQIDYQFVKKAVPDKVPSPKTYRFGACSLKKYNVVLQLSKGVLGQHLQEGSNGRQDLPKPRWGDTTPLKKTLQSKWEEPQKSKSLD